MDIRRNVREACPYRSLSLFAEILDGLLALLLLRVQALAEFVVAFLARFLCSIQPVAQECHVRVQPLTELLERLPYLLVVNL